MADISNLEMQRGWYMDTQKRPGTPGGWVFTTFNGMSAWGNCDRMQAASPATTCKLPQHIHDFKAHHRGEAWSWQKTSDLPMKQKIELFPEIYLGIPVAVLITVIILLISGFAVFKISRSD